jgi:hypothetical protein
MAWGADQSQFHLEASRRIAQTLPDDRAPTETKGEWRGTERGQELQSRLIYSKIGIMRQASTMRVTGGPLDASRRSSFRPDVIAVIESHICSRTRALKVRFTLEWQRSSSSTKLRKPHKWPSRHRTFLFLFNRFALAHRA